MDNVISLNSFVAQKEQDKKDIERAEYDALYQLVNKALEDNPPELAPFFAYSEADSQASTIDIAVMKLIDAITLLDSLDKKKESHIINRVVAD